MEAKDIVMSKGEKSVSEDEELSRMKSEHVGR